jgi:U6 snRNA phosphodiesterase
MDLIQGYESEEDVKPPMNHPKRAREENQAPAPSKVELEPPSKRRKLSDETLELPKFIFDEEEGAHRLNPESTFLLDRSVSIRSIFQTLIDVSVPFYCSETRKEEEERQKHQGRKRTFPHVAGNWPTSVFIPLDLNLGGNMSGISECIQSIRSRLLEEFKGRGFIDAKGEKHVMQTIEDADLHISISRTFALREHEFGLFLEHLRKSLRDLNAPSFDIDFDEYEWYMSDDSSRSFVSLNVREGVDKNAVCALIAAVDDALEVVGKPKFYEDPKPHVSISWCLGGVVESVKSCGLPLKSALMTSEKLTIPVKTIICKIGHRMFPFQLTTGV